MGGGFVTVRLQYKTKQGVVKTWKASMLRFGRLGGETITKRSKKHVFADDERRAASRRRPHKPLRHPAVGIGSSESSEVYPCGHAPALCPVEALRKQSRFVQALRWHDSRVYLSHLLGRRRRMGCGCSMNRRVAAQKVGKTAYPLLMS